VFAVPHDDDIRLVKWKKQYDQIPETSKDPVMLKKKKEMLKKKPSRNNQRKYWSEADFDKLKGAPPARLYSKGPLPWRLLAYLLKASPEIEKIRAVVRKRLLDQPRIEAGMKQLQRMLTILHERGIVVLDPPPPAPLEPDAPPVLFSAENPAPVYTPTLATPTPELDKLLAFRAVHPLYGAFLMEHLGIASAEERMQIFESVLELPRPLLKFVRVPFSLAPGPLQTERIDPILIQKGLIQSVAPKEEGDEEEDDGFVPWDERPPLLADKVRMLFDALNPDVLDVNTTPVWAAGELLALGGNFNTFITSKDLAKQEGLIFRHCLRLILMTEEFGQLTPAGVEPQQWQADMKAIADALTKTCEQVDPTSTEETIRKAQAAAKLEEPAVETPPPPDDDPADFAAGLED